VNARAMEFGLHDNPLDVLERWRGEAEQAGVPLPEAMTLATVDERGQPSARIVLWKGRRNDALWFFTNYHSRKARELSVIPRAAAVFHFALAERQVRVEGVVSKLSDIDSDTYFAGRPRESQLGAWASQQSQPLSDRHDLIEAVRVVEAQFDGRPVTRPPHWGGYALHAERIELWSGQVGRLHDRALYTKATSGWTVQRLYP